MRLWHFFAYRFVPNFASAVPFSHTNFLSTSQLLYLKLYPNEKLKFSYLFLNTYPHSVGNV